MQREGSKIRIRTTIGILDWIALDKKDMDWIGQDLLSRSSHSIGMIFC